VVPVLLGGGLMGAFYKLLSLPWFIFVAVLMAVEAWTLVNKYAGDTLSETVWALNARPLVPFLFAVFATLLLERGVIPSTPEGLWIAFALGGLMAHFFFSRHCEGG
jgi:hypothetical protein